IRRHGGAVRRPLPTPTGIAHRPEAPATTAAMRPYVDNSVDFAFDMLETEPMFTIPHRNRKGSRRSTVITACAVLLAVCATAITTASALTIESGLVAELVRGVDSSSAKPLGVVNGRALLVADTPNTGYELFVTDGTSRGTVLLKDVAAGTYGGVDYNSDVAIIGNIMFFIGDDGVNGQTLWRTDGTAAGTYSLDSDLSCANEPGSWAVVGSSLYYGAGDCLGEYELWKTDGTLANTTLITNLNASSNNDFIGEFAAVSGTTAVFAARGLGDTEIELWVTDGTGGGTLPLKDLNPDFGSEPIFFTSLGSKAIFWAYGTDLSIDLWSSDGTASGTVKLADIDAPSNREVAIMNSVAYFSSHDGTIQGNDLNRELWRTDGTVAGTYMVADINPNGASYPEALAVLNNTLLFSADNGTLLDELWKSDGTSGGTELVKDINPASRSFISEITVLNGVAYFPAYDETQTEIWSSDGTAAGTVLAADVDGDPLLDSDPQNLMPFRNGLLFTAYTDGTGYELFGLTTIPPYDCTAVTAKGNTTFTATWNVPAAEGIFITNVTIAAPDGTVVASKAGKSISGAYNKTIRGLADPTNYVCSFWSGNRRGDELNLERRILIGAAPTPGISFGLRASADTSGSNLDSATGDSKDVLRRHVGTAAIHRD
ncbi:MAG: hypothetical protein RL643_199, partial [Actinomycetota bacterium]